MNIRDSFFAAMPEHIYNQVLYYYLHLKKGLLPKVLNYNNPRTFNEKIIWLKLNYQHSRAPIFVDKVRVKEFVRDTIGEQYLIPTIQVFENPDQIDFDALPGSFVLKANHGSGWNIICDNKEKLDFDSTRERLWDWISTCYYKIGKERQYETIPRRIICEKYLGGNQSEALNDYKVFCFNGKAVYIQVDLDRFTCHTRSFYNLNWEKMPFTSLFPLSSRVLPRPEGLDEMLRIAKCLSSGLPFARIDFYYYEGRVYFGEITLHHGGGFEPFMPKQYDMKLGGMLDLSMVR